MVRHYSDEKITYFLQLHDDFAGFSSISLISNHVRPTIDLNKI